MKVVGHHFPTQITKFGRESPISQQAHLSLGLVPMVEKPIVTPSLGDQGFSETLRKALCTLAQPSSARAGCGVEYAMLFLMKISVLEVYELRTFGTSWHPQNPANFMDVYSQLFLTWRFATCCHHCQLLHFELSG